MGLAEPRIKQRISADPRNLAWSNGSVSFNENQDKFGYRMLSKMGWLPGKGLGVNEDGAKEHIKLSLKQDNLGVGATKKTIDNCESGSLSSIRLAHRAKFLKSKKAAIQNSDRLNEIFGIKSNKDTFDDLNNISNSPSSKSNKVITTITTTASSSEIDESDQNNSVKSIRKEDIVTNVNEMSAQEYFAQKMKGLKLSGIANSGLSDCNKMNAEIDERPSFSMGVCTGFVSNEQDANMSKNALSSGLVGNSNKKRKRDIDIDLVNSKKSIKKDVKSKKKEKKKKLKNLEKD
ncbi:16347_t:CDS:2 [Funneliformis mosseae]|uniref:16347_t:CDS:1 n=1 Tax=Funneliformis mosseae TaxID=27381 RepID=A0A9N9CBC6_FUNMO|nr:16347_t:CDS:2 [Funneliformis mosseae]